MKAMKFISPKLTDISNDSFVINAAQNQQGWGGYLFNTWNDMSNLALTQRSQLAKNTGGTPAGPGTINNVFLQGSYSEIRLANLSVGSVIIEIFDVIVKRDLNPTYTPAYIMNNVNISNLNSNKESTDALAIYTRGYHPFDNPAFTQAYTVTKRVQVELAGGEQHTHKIFVKYNKVWNSNLSVTTEFAGGQKGFTYGVLVRTLGGVVRGANVSQYGTSEHEVVGVVDHRISSRMTAVQAPHIEFYKYDAALTQPSKIVDEFAGQVNQAGTGFLPLQFTA